MNALICPVCARQHRYLAAVLTCCPRDLRRLTDAIEAGDCTGVKFSQFFTDRLAVLRAQAFLDRTAADLVGIAPDIAA